MTTLSRIAQGTQSVDPNSVNATQIGLIKGSSLQVSIYLCKKLFFALIFKGPDVVYTLNMVTFFPHVLVPCECVKVTS